MDIFFHFFLIPTCNMLFISNSITEFVTFYKIHTTFSFPRPAPSKYHPTQIHAEGESFAKREENRACSSYPGSCGS